MQKKTNKYKHKYKYIYTYKYTNYTNVQVKN